MSELKKKNPWVVVILNFFLPGIGFIYLGTVPFIIGGAVLFVFVTSATIAFWNELFYSSTLPLIDSLYDIFVLAAFGYVSTKYINMRRILPPPPPPS
jgi:dolichyl-phosphate-mannose--protein O-mannosyl transferase